MAIVLESPEYAKLHAQAGALIGEAQRRKEAQQIAVAQAEKAKAFERQKEMSIFNHQLDIERLKYNQLMQFEEEKRAKEWELEKMTIRSRVDFEQTEQKRLQTQQEYDLGMKYIDEKVNDGTIPPQKRGELEFNLAMKRLAGTNVTYTTPKVDTVEQLLAQRLQGLTAPTGTSTPTKMPIVAPITQPQSTQYQVGQPVTRGGKNYVISGFDAAGRAKVRPL